MNYSMLFPGQGSQSVGMLKALADEHKIVSDTFAEAADVLGVDYWKLAQTGPNETLADTRNTQPLMFIGNMAVWRVLQAVGLSAPSAVAGHSVGEFSAMVASNALSYKDGLTLVFERAQLMSKAVPDGEGGMAALIGMEDQDVVDLCKAVTGERIVEAANFNAPGQVAISGHKDALEKAIELAKEKGARKAIMLAVSVPNHSSLMRDAGAKLAETIDSLEWKMPSIPLVQNAQAAVPTNKDAMLDSLRAHVFSPVQWVKVIHLIRKEYNVDTFIECGPGKVVSGLGKRIDRKMTTLPCESPEALEKVLDTLAANA